MRKVTTYLLAVVFSISSNAGIIYVPANSTDNAKAGKISAVNVLGQLDAKAFLALTPDKVQEMTGAKMTFGQKLALKRVQNRVTKDPTYFNKINFQRFTGTDNRKFHWSTWGLLVVV